MFGSKSLPEHLARGIVGIGAFVAAVSCAPQHPWLALAAIVMALVALRGCPSCWLLGLVQTVLPRLGKPGGCVDGSCGLPPASKP